MSDFEVIDKPQNIAKGQCDIQPYIDDRENTVDSPFTIEEKKKLDKIFKQSQEAKYQVIENPFMIHSKFGIRVGLGKKERLDVNHNVQGGIFILPEKETIDITDYSTVSTGEQNG